LSDLPFKTDRKATPLICAASLDTYQVSYNARFVRYQVDPQK
jgi:hypothetical protein